MPPRPLFEPGTQDDRNYRLGLLWEPTSALSVYFQMENNDQKNFGGTTQPNAHPYIDVRQPADDPGTAIDESLGEPITFLNYSRYLDYDNPDPRVISRVHNLQYGNAETDRFNLDIAYEFTNGITFNSTTGYSTRDNLRVGGGNTAAWEDGTEGSTGMTNPQRLDTYDHEFTLISPDEGRLDWILGTAYRKTHNRLLSMATNNQGIDFGAAGLLTADGNPIYASCGYEPGTDPATTPPVACDTPIGSPYLRAETSLRVGTNQFTSIFGQFDFQFTNSIEFSFGFRQNWENLDPTAVDYLDIDEIQSINAAFMDAYGIARPAGVWEPCDNGNFNILDPSMIGTTFSGWECRFDPAQPPVVDAYKDQELDYKIGINWQPGDNNFIYAFYSRGHTSGGWRGVGLSNDYIIEPEVIEDYELGWKGSLMDGLIQAELGGYWMDYKNMHQNVFSANDQGGGDTTSNIGDSEIKGIEASLRTFIGSLGMNASVAYNKSELGQITTLDDTKLPGYADNDAAGEYPQCNFVPGQVANDPVTAVDPVGSCFDYDGRLGVEPNRYVTLDGRENPASPALSYNLSFDYEIQLSNGTLTPRLQFSHTDGSWSNLLQNDPRDFLGDRDVIDFSVLYNVGNYTIQGFVNNLADELYATSTGENIQYGAPRTYGLRARMNF